MQWFGTYYTCKKSLSNECLVKIIKILFPIFSNGDFMVISDVWKHYKSSAKTLNFISAIEHVKVSGKPIIKLKSALSNSHNWRFIWQRMHLCVSYIITKFVNANKNWWVCKGRWFWRQTPMSCSRQTKLNTKNASRWN